MVGRNLHYDGGNLDNQRRRSGRSLRIAAGAICKMVRLTDNKYSGCVLYDA